MTVTGLVYTALAVGPAAWQISKANALPALVRQAHRHAGGHARLGTYARNTPNIVYYAHGHVGEWGLGQASEALAFLTSGDDAVLLIPEQHVNEIAGLLPPEVGVIGKARPLFQKHDLLMIGTVPTATHRLAAPPSLESPIR